MHHIEVLVASQRYHGQDPLTYSCVEPLEKGGIVTVPLGNSKVPAIVLKNVAKPAFTTKPIVEIASPRPIPKELLQLREWLKTYYPSPSGLINQLFVPSGLKASKAEKPPAVMESLPKITTPPLRAAQKSIVDSIEKSPRRAFLLHGDTGSGKTRVYIELVFNSLMRGKSAIVLTPEIGLIPQLGEVFERALPGRIVEIHSGQTPAVRRKNWLKILHTDVPLVVIGPRSALFSPLKDIGVIVVDEAHDSAYKQEQSPRYVTSRVAGKLASLHDAKLVLGSATPSVDDYFTFTHKNLPILRLHKPKATNTQPDTTVVDIKDRSNFSRSPWLSNQLLDGVASTLAAKQQSLVFLNRRGTAKIILCQSCGWQETCKRCDLPLTYHGDLHQMRCHTCGFTAMAKTSCPVCESTDIRFKNVGTKTITDELIKIFPGTNVKRFDSDNLKAEQLDAHFSDVQKGKVDILVGTQLLSKGLDLPRLRFVGIVSADTGLYFPDYTAQERTYQMLNQVIGRVGRGHQKGSVVVQTYQPASDILRAAIGNDYLKFYDSQIAAREKYRFPPFCFTLKISVQRKTSSNAAATSHRIADTITQLKIPIEVTGPTPAFMQRTNNKYNWQIIVKAKQREALTRVISTLPPNCIYDIDPVNLL